MIEKIALNGKPIYKLPTIKTKNKFDFSFSGLKSFCFRLLNDKNKKINLPDFCASLQTHIVKILIQHIHLTLKKYPNISTFIIAGGVASNNFLREQIKIFQKT
jgi:N6-L-threonylcarbamoyladenine synthase